MIHTTKIPGICGCHRMITSEGLADRGEPAINAVLSDARAEIEQLLKGRDKNPVTIHIAVTAQPIDEPSTLPPADGS